MSLHIKKRELVLCFFQNYSPINPFFFSQSRIFPQPLPNNFHSIDLTKTKNLENSNFFKKIPFKNSLISQTDRQTNETTEGSMKRRLIYKGLRNYQMNSYSSLIKTNYKSSENYSESYREAPFDKNGGFTERKIWEFDKNQGLKQKIAKNSILENFTGRNSEILKGLYEKFLNKTKERLRNTKKNKKNDEKNRVGVEEILGMQGIDRKFEDFFKDLAKKEYSEGKIMLILENFALETAKIKSQLRYNYVFIGKVRF